MIAAVASVVPARRIIFVIVDAEAVRQTKPGLAHFIPAKMPFVRSTLSALHAVPTVLAPATRRWLALHFFRTEPRQRMGLNMKKMILAVLLGVASLSAYAQATPATPAAQTDESVQVPGRALRIELPALPLHMGRDQSGAFRGSYLLSNGQVLHLRQYGSGPALYGEIDQQGARKMVAASPNTFVAVDRSLKVTLLPKADGDFGGEVLLRAPAQRLADGTMSQGKVMSATVR